MAIKNRTAIEITNTITPLTLFGIDQKMAYEDKKYHSGQILTSSIK
jgi:hypothetical protein